MYIHETGTTKISNMPWEVLLTESIVISATVSWNFGVISVSKDTRNQANIYMYPLKYIAIYWRGLYSSALIALSYHKE